jgi:hypothetical protein
MSEPSNPQNPFGDDKPIVSSYQHQPVSARVPEKVAKGVYSTGQLILDTPKEFIVDFLHGLTRPHQIVSRVIMVPQTMQEFANALKLNIENYTKNFGPPPQLPIPPNPPRPTIQEIYDNYKLSDDMLSGTYCNSVLIGHSPSEFFFDFITSFYPTPSVASRVFITAGQAPRFLNTLTSALQQYQARYLKAPPPPDQLPPPPNVG